jgi:hypothetical protein
MTGFVTAFEPTTYSRPIWRSLIAPLRSARTSSGMV